MPATEKLPPSIDARGRVLTLGEEDARRRIALALQALDAIDSIGDEEEQRATYETLKQAIDEDGLSRRKRFRG